MITTVLHYRANCDLHDVDSRYEFMKAFSDIPETVIIISTALKKS